MKEINQFPLDSLILFSLKELDKGNIEISDKIHEVFKLKVKEDLKKAQKLLNSGETLKSDEILKEITKAKIAQSEWIYLSTQNYNVELNTKNINYVLNSDIYIDIKNTNEQFIKNQVNHLKNHFENANFLEVEKRSKQLIVIFPRELKFQNYLGLSQIALNKNIQSLKTFENALKFNENNPLLLSNMALAQVKAGFKEHGELFYRKALLIDKNLYEANKNLGILLVDQKNFDEAEFYLKKSIKINEKCSVSNANLAVVFRQKNKFALSLEYSIKACTLSSGNHKLINNLGLSYKLVGEIKKAEYNFRKAINIFPEFYEAHNNLGSVIYTERPDEAIYHYEIACKNKDILAIVYFNLANVFREKENSFKSLYYINKSISIDPNSSSAFRLLGIINFEKGYFKKSVNAFKRSIELNKDNTEVYRLMGRIYSFKDTEVQNMLNLLDEISYSDNEIKHLYFALGEIYEKRKNFKLSFKYFEKANKTVNKQLRFSADEEKLKFKNTRDLFLELKKEKPFFSSKKRSIIFVIGMPRSGTTLVEQIISNNDFTYAGGEIAIIPKLLDEVVSKRINRITPLDIDNYDLLENLRNLYYGYLDTKTDKEIIIDKMPYNFIFTGIIKLAFPEAKFIHVKRNFNDNCLSIYKNYFSNNGQPFAYEFQNIRKYYKLYKSQTEFWDKEFSENIYQIEYESLIHNTVDTIMNLVEFSDFKWSNNYIQFYKNKRLVYTASSSQVRSKIYNSSINSWKNYSEFF